MLNSKTLQVEVNNIPKYPLSKYVVATYDDIGKQLWFYGTYDDFNKAAEVANQLPTGIILIYSGESNTTVSDNSDSSSNFSWVVDI